MPYTPAFHQSVAAAETITILGGEIGSGPVVDSYSAIATAGVIAKWEPAERLLQPLSHAAIAITANQVFLIGGWNGRTVQRTVSRARIDSAGRLTNWVALPEILPEPRRGARAFVREGEVLVIGGEDASGRPSADVWSAPVGLEGLSGPWRLAGTLVEPVSEPAVLQAQDWTFLLGGRYQNARRQVNALPPGSATGWQPRPALPEPLFRSAYAKAGDRLFLIAGSDDTSVRDYVFTAPLLLAGGIGPWTRAVPLPQALAGASAVTLGGNVFVTGGYDGTRYQASVFRMPVGAVAQQPAPTPTQAGPPAPLPTLPELPIVEIVGAIGAGALLVAVVLLAYERLASRVGVRDGDG